MSTDPNQPTSETNSASIQPEVVSQPVVENPPVQPEVVTGQLQETVYQTVTTNQISPPSTPVSPVPVKLPSEIKKFWPFMIALLAILTGITVFLVIQRLQPPKPTPGPVTIVITPTPTPTPIRQATVVSTSQTFMDFQTEIASFSAGVKEYEKDDPMLSPPILTLPLGFTK